MLQSTFPLLNSIPRGEGECAVPSVRASHMRVASARVLIVSTDAVAAAAVAAAAAPRSICGHNEGCGIWGPEAPRSTVRFILRLAVARCREWRILPRPVKPLFAPRIRCIRPVKLGASSGHVSYFWRIRARNETHASFPSHLSRIQFNIYIYRSLYINSFILMSYPKF